MPHTAHQRPGSTEKPAGHGASDLLQLTKNWTARKTASRIHPVAKISRALILIGKGGCDGARTGVVSQRPEALFVIDDGQRIVQWSNAAAVTLGVSPD